MSCSLVGTCLVVLPNDRPNREFGRRAETYDRAVSLGPGTWVGRPARFRRLPHADLTLRCPPRIAVIPGASYWVAEQTVGPRARKSKLQLPGLVHRWSRPLGRSPGEVPWGIGTRRLSTRCQDGGLASLVFLWQREVAFVSIPRKAQGDGQPGSPSASVPGELTVCACQVRPSAAWMQEWRNLIRASGIGQNHNAQ